MFSPRGRSILAQFLTPAVVVLVGAGVVVPALQALLAVRAQGARELAHLQAIGEGLRGVRFLYSPEVLKRLKKLTGAEFAVVGRDGTVRLATLNVRRLPVGRLPSLEATRLEDLGQLPLLRVSDRAFLAAVLVTQLPAAEEQLVVLYPQSEWRWVQWRAARVPLLVGGGVALVAGAWVVWHAWRLRRALGAIRASVRQLPRAVRNPLAEQQPAPGVSSEIDELRWVIQEAAEELRRMEREVAERERERIVTQIGRGLAHHVRNSLAAARLLLSLHLDDCPGAGDLRQTILELQLAEYQLRGFLYLTRDAHELSAACKLPDAIRAAVQLVRPRCEHQQVELSVELPRAELTAHAPPEAVKTAIVSLLLNALEAVPAGSGRITVRAARRDSKVVVEVVDNGPGLDQEVQERLFMPWVTNKPGGLGLGLAIARQICQTYGGDLRYVREPCLTRFCITLPAASAAGGHSDDQRRQQDRLAIPDRAHEERMDEGGVEQGGGKHEQPRPEATKSPGADDKRTV